MEKHFTIDENKFFLQNKTLEFSYLFGKLNEQLLICDNVKKKLNLLKILDILIEFTLMITKDNKNTAIFDLENTHSNVISKHLSLLVKKYTKVFKTNKTKTRADVSFSKRKLWKQKGTGKARVGSKNSPLLRGGGVVFGPKGLISNIKINKKLRKRLFFSSFTLKASNLLLIDMLDRSIFNSIMQKKVLVLTNVLEKNQVNIFSKFSNYKNTNLKPINMVNAFDILRADVILITEKGLFELLKRLII